MMQNSKEKVLIVIPGGSFFAGPFLRAFSELGFEYRVFDHRRGAVFTSKILRRVLHQFPFLKFLKRQQIARTNRALIAFVNEYRPKYLFALKGESIRPDTLMRIKKMGVTTICFYNDMMSQWGYISTVAPVYDYFFSVDGVVLKHLQDGLGLKNCFFLSLAAEPRPDPFSKRCNQYDISFIGQHNPVHYSRREEYLQKISDLNLHIWGTPSWGKTSLSGLFHGPSIGDQRFDIYSQSKIVLDINWDLMETDFVSSRAFEAMSCGALFMTDGLGKNQEVFEENKEIVIFRNENELREKILYYLGHDQERERIARAGYAKVMTEHTYTARVKQILEHVKGK